MESLYERCRNNQLIFTNLRPQTFPDQVSDLQPAQSELEEVFNRRTATAPATRMDPNRAKRRSPSGEVPELDSEFDEVQSELGSEFSEAVRGSKRTTKLNRLADLLQREKITPKRPGSSSAKSPLPPVDSPNMTLMASVEPVAARVSELSNVVAPTESQSTMRKLCGSFYWNLVTVVSVTVGFLLTELVFKQTVKILLFLKNSVEQAGNFLWTNYVNPTEPIIGGRQMLFGENWKKIKLNEVKVDEILTLVWLIPAIVLLGISYGIIWTLHMLNVVLLTEIQLF